MHQAITWTSADTIEFLRMIFFSDIWIKLCYISFKEIHLKISFAKCRPPYSGLERYYSGTHPRTSPVISGDIVDRSGIV